MKSERLAYIKRVQREYKEKFDDELHVDFPRMNGIRRQLRPLQFIGSEVETRVNQVLNKYDLKLEDIKSRRITNRNYRVQLAFREICVLALTHGWNIAFLCRLVNKDRSSIYYHGRHQTQIIDEETRWR